MCIDLDDAQPFGNDPQPMSFDQGLCLLGQLAETIDEFFLNVDQLVKVWGDLCKPSDNPPDPAFKAVYPYFTTMTGNKFRFRGGDPVLLRGELQKLLSGLLNSPVKAHVES